MKMIGQNPVQKPAKLVGQKLKLPVFSATPESIAERDLLLHKALAVSTVSTSEQNLAAANVVTEMRRRVKAVKAARVELAAPIDKARASLIQIEKDYCAPIEAEIKRIESASGEWLDAEEKRVEQEEKARAAEVLRLENERKVLEASKTTSTPKQVASIEKKLDKTENQFQSLVRQDLPEVERAKGQSRRDVLNVVVVDLKAAYAAMPHCFDIVPKKAVLNACCVPGSDKNEANKETKLYPGVECWWIRETTFRS